MEYKNRNGKVIKHNETQDSVLNFLYQTLFGRILLAQLIKPWVSKCGGVFLSHPVSKIFIAPFVKKNQIDLTEYEKQDFYSYNEFFSRKKKKEYCVIDHEPEHLIAPCDAKLSVYPIKDNAHFKIKNTIYTMESLLKSKKLASYFEGGQLLLFRLTVDDYHRFCYIDNGVKSKNYHIPGVFHTVNPIANDVTPIYKQNTREYCLLKSENFGNILVMEVGALMVGKIVNYHEETNVARGEEKGKFEFGGSTIIVCVQKDKVEIDQDILENSMNNVETIVKMGEKIGKANDRLI
jgi:phosphatidylserine decarboxylase